MSVNDILTISEPLVLTSERNLRILARHIAREWARPLSEVINEIEHLYVRPPRLSMVKSMSSDHIYSRMAK